jgi:hypothetical protein
VKALILAAGESSRWGNYRGGKKHFLTIDNEVLIHRTVRQCLQYTDDVTVVGLDLSYKVDGADLFVPDRPNPAWLDMAKFRSSMELWSNSRTVLVLGDVYFTDYAIDQLFSSTQTWVFLLRKNHSIITGGRPEVFGLAFDHSMQSHIKERIQVLIDGKVAPHAGGWRLYKDLIRPSYGDPFNNNHHISIDDWTTDFDYPSDLDEFESRRV